MNERKHFIDAHQRGELSVSELCRRFGISRKTGYKWLERFYADGGDEQALRDRARRPHSHPKAVPTWLEEAIVHARQQRPTGARRSSGRCSYTETRASSFPRSVRSPRS